MITLSTTRRVLAGAVSALGLGVLACTPAGTDTDAPTTGVAQADARTGPMTQAGMTEMLASWPEHARAAAMDQMQKYGPPQEVTASTLTWRGKGPWLWTRIDKMETPHAFPGPHPDLMEQAVHYRVPADKVDELNAYDGSVTVYRTQGYLTARCDKEGANFLALNLAHDIITGTKTVAAARAYYAAAITASKAGRMDPYMTELKFAPQGARAADPDQAAA
ncbi:MAG: hypothetical protein M3Q74_06245 [Pseudomonadota bacterium]|nr:hypothetical protein [Pseudomonadota bacterium]